MSSVHVFVSSGRFRSLREMSEFANHTYTNDGDSVPSRFATEVDLSHYEPATIEIPHSESGVPGGSIVCGPVGAPITNWSRR